MREITSSKAKTLTLAGLFAALVFAATYIFKIPTGTNGGYIHVGDAAVYLAASLLPLPLAAAASAIGACLSDIMTPGAAVWAVPTAVIKPLCCLFFSRRAEKLLTRRNLLATLPAAAVTALGYGAVTVLFTGSVAVAVAETPLALIQSFASALCYVAAAAVMDRADIKNKIFLPRR